MGKIFLAFTLIPLVEVALLIKIGQNFGALPTILLVIITGGTGVFLAKNQGLFVLGSIQHNLQQGIVPGDALIEGLLVFAGSILLVTPGLLTDLFGFFLLVPVSRIIVRNYLKYKFKEMIDNGKINVYFNKY